MKQRIKTAKGRAISSTNWLKRQINDPFVKQSVKDGYRSRAAYKLLEINKKFHLIKSGDAVLDLGSSPGGWSQVAVELVQKNGRVFAIDKIKMDPIKGVEFFQHELCNDISKIDQKILSIKFDAIISDIAPNTMGHSMIDSVRSIELAKFVIMVAQNLLKAGGGIAIKMLRGSSDEQEFFNDLKKNFKLAKYFKPKSSRKESREIYLILR